jgi:hypothetical protein
MTIEGFWVSPVKASRAHLHVLWSRPRKETWLLRVDPDAPIRLHPNRAQLKKYADFALRVGWTVLPTFVVTIVVMSLFDSRPLLRPVANTVAVALFAGLVGMIIGPAARVVDEYRSSSRQLRTIMWELIAASDDDRTPTVDEGTLLALLIDQFALMQAADARRFVALARCRKLKEDDLHRVLIALP